MCASEMQFNSINTMKLIPNREFNCPNSTHPHDIIIIIIAVVVVVVVVVLKRSAQLQ